MIDSINRLYDKDNIETYKLLLKLEEEVTESNKLYNYFDIVLNMLNNPKDVIKIRGFRLISALSKWDVDNKINNNIDIILKVFDSKNGVLIRQCLSKINLLLLYKIELKDKIEDKLNSIDLSIYKESMQSLIEKDIKNILENL